MSLHNHFFIAHINGFGAFIYTIHINYMFPTKYILSLNTLASIQKKKKNDLGT